MGAHGVSGIGKSAQSKFDRSWAFRKEQERQAVERAELQAYRALGTVEELTRGAALREAQDEGRVVVLDATRKPLVWGYDDHNSCLCPDCCEDLMGIPYGEFKILQCPACGQYLDATKIITRAEAEAAQREEGQA